VTLGTFSTYALLPHLFALRQNAGEASFEVLMLGGPPSQDAGDTGTLPTMTVRYDGPAQLRAAGVALKVEHYRVLSSMGESDLYAHGAEFSRSAPAMRRTSSGSTGPTSSPTESRSSARRRHRRADTEARC